MKKDYYEILGISKTATPDEIKKSYRAKCKETHPDANPDNPEAEEKFKEISEAYTVLNDANKKAAYDRYGHSAFDGTGNTTNPYHNFRAGGSGGFGFDINDILRGFQSQTQQPVPTRGFDISTNINITFEESVFGAQKTVQFEMNEICGVCSGSGGEPGTEIGKCEKCNGTGQERLQQSSLMGMIMTVTTCSGCHGSGKSIKNPCGRCKGNGKIRTPKTLEVTIPKGIDNNQSIRIAEQGEYGERGGPRGNLLIKVNVVPHRYFRREGMNLILDVPMTFIQAALGDTIDIPLLDGETQITIAPGTQSDARITLAGKGIPDVRNNTIMGDLIIILKLEVPTDLTEKQKEILQEFDKISQES